MHLNLALDINLLFMTTLKTFNDKFSLRINKWNDRQQGLKPY